MGNLLATALKWNGFKYYRFATTITTFGDGVESLLGKLVQMHVCSMKPFGVRSWNYGVLFNVILQEAAFAEEEGEEEGTGLIGTPPAGEVQGWVLFGKLLNRVCFAVTMFVYLLMFVRCFT
jgi:hypothetical protein